MEKNFLEIAQKFLINRKIVDVRYMTKKEADEMMWCYRSILVVLDDGSDFIIQSDDEGNEAGVLNLSNGDIIPRISK